MGKTTVDQSESIQLSGQEFVLPKIGEHQYILTTIKNSKAITIRLGLKTGPYHEIFIGKYSEGTDPADIFAACLNDFEQRKGWYI